MSRRYGESIATLETDSDGQPVAFVWREQHYVVQVLAKWRLRSYWWDPTRATERTYYRVATADHRVFELYRDQPAGGWVLDVCQG